MYNMCKCCQSCFESAYWHCIEKRFCYDDSIALYEEPKQCQDEKNNNSAFDNMAFYDNVALIAGRPIFTIEPLPEKTKPVEKQPRANKTLRWWEDIEKQNRENENKYSGMDLSIPTIHEDVETSSSDTAELDRVNDKESNRESGNVTEATNLGDKQSGKDEKKDTLDVESLVPLRRKSLTERRMSKSLTLIVDPAELPVIRQNSMPKFYLDSPDVNQVDSSIAPTPSAALASPVMPESDRFKFDLRSVVQMEKEKSQSFKDSQGQSRLAFVRKKIIPLKIKRHSSLMNLHSNSISKTNATSNTPAGTNTSTHM